jgi:hypothetical protein
MLLEAHLPERGATPVPAAARLAEALRESTQQGAKAIRERRVPVWDAVRAAVEAWEKTDSPSGKEASPAGEEASSAGEGAARVPSDDAFVGGAARLVLDALTELSEALDTAVPPMTLDGTSAGAGSGTGSGTEPGTGSGTKAAGVRNPGSP